MITARNFLPDQYRSTNQIEINHNYLSQQFADHDLILEKIREVVLRGDFTLGTEVDRLESITAEEFAQRMKANPLHVFDVRKPGEWAAEHLVDAQHASLQFINTHLAAFSKNEPNYIHCQGGYRSMIAASLLKARGYHNVIDVAGGFAAIKRTDLATTDPICATTLRNGPAM